MKNFFYFFLLLLFISCRSTQHDTACKDFFKDGTYFYDNTNLEKKSEAMIVMKNDIHIEYVNADKKEYVTSQLKWTNDCEFILTVIDSKVANFDLKKGEQMIVKILSIHENKMNYESVFRGFKLVRTIQKKIEE